MAINGKEMDDATIADATQAIMSSERVLGNGVSGKGNNLGR